jgi:hypothetical protein
MKHHHKQRAVDQLPLQHTPPYKIVILSGIQQLLDSSTHCEGPRGSPCVCFSSDVPYPSR